MPILVVDDDIHARSLLLTALRGGSATELKACTQPDEAYELLQTWNAGLIITEYGLQPVGGAEFVRTLRKDPQHRFLAKPIVMITSEAPSASLVTEIKEAGVDALVPLPIIPQELFKRMEWALKQARQRAENAILAAKKAQQAQRAQKVRQAQQKPPPQTQKAKQAQQAQQAESAKASSGEKQKSWGID